MDTQIPLTYPRWAKEYGAQPEPPNFASVISYNGYILVAARPLMSDSYTIHVYTDTTTPGKTRQQAMDTLWQLYEHPESADTLVPDPACPTSVPPTREWSSLADYEVGPYIGSVEVHPRGAEGETCSRLKTPSLRMLELYSNRPYLIPMVPVSESTLIRPLKTATLCRPDLATATSLPSSYASAVKFGNHCWIVGDIDPTTGKACFVFVANNKNNDFRHAQTIGTLYSLRESSLRAPLLLSNRSREWDTVQWGQVPPEEVESCAGTF